MAIIRIPKHFHPNFATPLQKPVCPVVIDYNTSGAHGLVVVGLFNHRVASPFPLELFDGAIKHGNLIGDGTVNPNAVLRNLFEDNYPGTGDFTIYLDVKAPTVAEASNQNRELFNDYEAGGIPTNHFGQLYLKSNGTLWSMRGGGLFSVLHDTTFDKTLGGRLRCLIIRRNGVAYGFLNGILVSSGANTDDFFNRKSYTNHCYFGAGDTSRTSAAAEYISFAYWTSALATPPHSFDINQILKPAMPQVYFTTSGPVVIPITVSAFYTEPQRSVRSRHV